jgi:electron transport complex protein RnfB
MLAERIDALLPQTQCRRCGFDGCRPYAEALAGGESALNRCPPGGQELIGQLAVLLGRPELPLDPDCGQESPPLIALIDEEACIGCARCLDDCPTDAIVGARKRMHTVITEDCSGCELCLPCCPVDCIHMVNLAVLPAQARGPRAAHYRHLYDSRRARLARGQTEWRDALRASLARDGAPAD